MSTPLNPGEPDLQSLAVPYALHAVSEPERAEIETRLWSLEPEAAQEFLDEVRAVRDAMAQVSVTTALRPPGHLRDRVLQSTRAAAASPPPAGRRWRPALLAAAAAVVIGAGAVGVGVAVWPKPQPSTAQQVFAAPDVRTVSGELPTGGTATLVFSHDRHAGVLVMNNVPPPTQGTVYQMWLIGRNGPTSAGTMDAKAVTPSTTAVLPDIGDSTALAFTVEPGTGSPQPTGAVFAKLPLV